MAVDTATHIGNLDVNKPADGDYVSEGDDNIRQVKSVLVTDLPNIKGVVSASHTELSYVTGVTSPIQAQLDSKASTASPTLTGTPLAPTATAGTNTTQIATTAFVSAAVAGVTGSTDALTLSVSNSASVSLVAGQHDCATYSGAVTWTLPASPSVGQRCGIMVGNGLTTNVVARNGSNIMGLAEDMTVDNVNASIVFRYVSVSLGWRIV